MAIEDVKDDVLRLAHEQCRVCVMHVDGAHRFGIIEPELPRGGFVLVAEVDGSRVRLTYRYAEVDSIAECEEESQLGVVEGFDPELEAVAKRLAQAAGEPLAIRDVRRRQT